MDRIDLSLILDAKMCDALPVLWLYSAKKRLFIVLDRYNIFCYNPYTLHSFGDRLMVGQQTLDLLI